MAASTKTATPATRRSKGTLYITGDAQADALLNGDPFALLLGMLLDQQVPMEWAFRGPATLNERLGGELSAARLAALDEDAVVELFCRKPAVHRFPAAMARRAHEMSIVLVERYDGDAAKLWKGARSGAVVYERLRELPGFGEEKAQIFVALLAKRMGVRPTGWEAAAGVFSDGEPRSAADSHDPESFQQVRAFKKAMKAAKKDKQGRATT